MELLINVLAATVVAGTPLLLAALGELICERSGVLNLGQEGMMLMGAVAGFVATLTSGSLMVAVAAILAGIAMSMLFAFMAVTLAANQYAAGLALTIFGIGLSAFVGAGFVGESIDGFSRVAIPLLSEIPLIGRVVFDQDPLVYVSLVAFAAVWVFLRHTRGGLLLRAVGKIRTPPMPMASRCWWCATSRWPLAVVWPVWPAPTCLWPTPPCGPKT